MEPGVMFEYAPDRHVLRSVTKMPYDRERNARLRNPRRLYALTFFGGEVKDASGFIFYQQLLALRGEYFRRRKGHPSYHY